MKGLLPEELIQDLLKETGAYNKKEARRIIHTVGEFRPFQIKRKSHSEFNLSLFEDVFDQLVISLQKDWKENFIKGCSIGRRESQLMSLKKFKFREESVCVLLKNKDVTEPFFFYMSPSGFYCLLNQYLGGLSMTSAKENIGELTEIESSVLKKITQSFLQCLQNDFASIHPSNLDIARLNLNEEGQKDFYKMEFLTVDFLLNFENDKHQFSLVIPISFLKFVKNILDSQDETEQKKTDPLWKKVVTKTVLSTDIDLKINMGEFSIPFEKSLNLKVGDVFTWEKYGPQVVVSFLERPRMKGTVGTVGENYAIHIDELLS